MKKIYLLFALIAFVTASSAQKVTEANLMGKWKLCSLSMFGVDMDIDTGKITISDESLKTYKWSREEMEASLEEKLTNELKDDYILFENNLVIKYMIFDQAEEETKKYVLRESGDKQYLKFIDDEEGVVFFKDSKLHYIISKEGVDAVFVFKKVKK
jgi:hypothetical protein